MKDEINLRILENTSGEGVVSFEPWSVQGPEYAQDNSRWYCHLTVGGQRIFEYGCPCGTCGIVFRKLKSAANRISDAEAVELLGSLDAIPSDSVLLRLARILKPGAYYPVITEGTIRRIEPGAKEDYFANDVVRLFGLDAPEYKEPSSPKTPYYRIGTDRALNRTGRTSGPHKALITAVIMPLQDPASLKHDRVEYWKQQHAAGNRLTALAVSVIDDQAPAMDPKDQTYEYKEQFLLTNCLLDGHHRAQAAAELGAPLRILSLFTKDFSLVKDDKEIISVLSGYSPQR